MDGSPETPPRSKEDLLDRVRTAHEEFEGTVALLRHEQMTEPLLEAGWSVKDVLAHIADWEQLTIERLNARSNPEELARIQDEISNTQIDDLNDHLYRKSINVALREVRIRYNTTHDELIALLEDMPEDDLLQPGRSTLWDGDPLGRLVAGNTYLHYPEHKESIERILKHTKESSEPGG